jgi:hypothetical protein
MPWCRMDKATAIALLRERSLTRYSAGSERQRWLAWLAEFSRAEETLQTLSGLLTSCDEAPPRSQ